MTAATEQLFSSSSAKASSVEQGSPSSYRLNVADVAAQFSLEYYNTMSRQPESLHAFYGKQSHMIHSVEGDLEAPICSSIDAIHTRVTAMNYQASRIIVESIDAQPSMNGGIFVQTTGNMRMKTGATRKFVQSFFLAEQPNGYFVLNDALRYIELAPQQPSSVAQQTQSVPQENKQKPVDARPPKPAKVEAAPATPAAPVEPKPVQVEQPLESKEQAKPISGLEKAVQKPVSSQSTKAPAAKAPEPVSANPGSWASLAAGRTELWKDGVVAPQKASAITVAASEPVQSVKPNNKSERQDFKPRQARENRPSDHSPKPTQDYSRSVFVRNFSSDASADELRKVLTAAGKITSFDMNPVKCQAFVEYETVASAEIAISAKYTFMGTSLSIEHRRPANFRPGNFNRSRRE